MNQTQVKLLDILKKLKNEYGVVSVKAEFEAEGVRSDELIWLLELANKSDLKTALKIGGCEAVRDLIDSVTYGCDYIIAPMIESKYSLEKFILAKDKIYPDITNTQFLFNLETITGFQNKVQMFDEAKDRLDGCVFGRVDYTGSLGIKRDQIENSQITDDVLEVAKLAKSNNLDLVVGGGISSSSLKSLKTIKDKYLSRFETRKIVFSSDALYTPNIENGLALAVEFELLWLQNKRRFYSNIYKEDESRIKLLENRKNN